MIKICPKCGYIMVLDTLKVGYWCPACDYEEKNEGEGEEAACKSRTGHERTGEIADKPDRRVSALD